MQYLSQDDMEYRKNAAVNKVIVNEVKRSKSSKHKSGNKKYLLLIALLVILIICCLAFFNNGNSDVSAEQTTATDISKEWDDKDWFSEVESYSGETIASEIREMSELVTAEYKYTHVETYDSKKQFKNLKLSFATTSCIYSIDGKVTAGLDFSSVGVEIDNQNNKVIVSLDKPSIFSNELYHNTFKIFNEKKNIFNPVDFEDVNDSFIDVQEDEESKAIEDGLLDTARENAEALLTSMIRNFVPKSYSITFEYNK